MVKQLATLCILSFAALFSSWAKAQTIAMPMADRVPDDAVAYIGWAGADSQSKAFQASDLSAFLSHSNLSTVAGGYLTKLWDQLAQSSGDEGAVAGLKKSLPPLWHHPVAIYASNVTISPDGTPDANVALICDAGVDAAELKENLETAIKGEPHLHVVVQDSLVIVSLDHSPTAKDGQSLAEQPGFIGAMKSLQPSPAIAIYVDARMMLQKANESAAANDKASEIWPKVRDALGIDSVKFFALTAGFDGNNWMMASTLDAPNPRTGLLAAIEPKPIDPALLARVPASTGSVSVYNFDLAKLFDTIGQAMVANPDSDRLFHQAAGLATMGLGRNFRQQILAPLGTQWVMYSDARLHSVVLLNHPSDADTASDSMVSAIFGLANLANTQIPGATTQPIVNLDQKTIKGIDLTSAVTKSAAPTFAAKDGILYFGLSADSVVNSASLPAVSTAQDVLHGDNFMGAVQRLGVSNFASFDYSDLPKTAPRAYDNFGSADTLRQIMQMFGIEIPKIELPPLDQFKAHLSPALSVSLADDKGVYSKSISPFPMSTYLLGDPQQSMVGTTTLSAATAVLMPALQRARQQAMSVQLMSNERQILLGLVMYAQAHHGELPPDLGTLVSEGALQKAKLELFLKPGSKTKVPKEIAQGSPQQQTDWVNDNTEFIFLLPGKNLRDLRNVSQMAALVPKDAGTAITRTAVGFVDGHVEMCKPERVQHLLQPDNP